jgi:hypothetical protein
MHPQMKRPWSFQPWTMSLSGQYVPRVKLINGFYVPSIFCPWMFHPSQYSPFLGTLWPPLIFKLWLLVLVIVSPFATPMDFYREKNCQNLNFPHIKLQNYLFIRFAILYSESLQAKICSKRDSLMRLLTLSECIKDNWTISTALSSWVMRLKHKKLFDNMFLNSAQL